MVELRAVHKAYLEGSGLRTVLEGVDLSISAGETVALFGRSGSGKSTLLHLVSGIDLPDRGEVVVHGAALSRMSEKERTLFRRSHIGFVFQFFNLVPTLTVEENVLLPLELTGQLDPKHRRRALELLERVGLAQRARSYPDILSGGEQQRVAVARALAHDPTLLLADEPTGNLDEHTGQQVLELLRELAGGGAKTVIMATHSRHNATIAQRVLRLSEGEVHPCSD
ncbi:MAG: ABC transporter ATP-binding protein [Armatimonadetes bacterium]|nr:ABC transporter ATP-binding protein [Armatimonadota bacterium]